MTHTIAETAESLPTANNTSKGMARAAHHPTTRPLARPDNLSEQHDAWVESAGNQIRARPLTSLAIAVAAGLLIDRLLR